MWPLYLQLSNNSTRHTIPPSRTFPREAANANMFDAEFLLLPLFKSCAGAKPWDPARQGDDTELQYGQQMAQSTENFIDIKVT